MPSVRVYQKKQIRLDRLNFRQTQMFKIGNVGVAAVLLVARSRLVPRWLVVTTLLLALAADLTALKATGWAAAAVALLVAAIALGTSIRRIALVAVVVVVSAQSAARKAAMSAMPKAVTSATPKALRPVVNVLHAANVQSVLNAM